MAARIFQKSKNPTQSGKAHADEWVLQFESHRRFKADPLMGWPGGGDTQAQVSIGFPSLEAARAYAEKYDIPYHVVPATTRKLRIQSYADNFR